MKQPLLQAGTFFQKVRANEPPLLHRKAQSFCGRDVRVVKIIQIPSALSASMRFDLAKERSS
jgi:hypothetical protein